MKTLMQTDNLVFVGRFQPFHNGHLAVIKEALSMTKNLVVAIGSSFAPRSSKNPLTFDERKKIISEALGGLMERVIIIPTADRWNTDKWTKDLLSSVNAIGLQGTVGMVGHRKDKSSFYLSSVPEWESVEISRHGIIDASAIRAASFTSGDRFIPEGLARQMPAPSVAAYNAFCQSSQYPALRDEFFFLADEKDKWKFAPYEPTFNTADSVLFSMGHVLFIRRKNFPGKGLLALPGGYVEPGETLLQSAIRELEEEAGIVDPKNRLVCSMTFDNPERDLRGRIITMAHLFELDSVDGAPPKAYPGSDAEEVEWIHHSMVRRRSSEMFSDHVEITEDLLRVAGLV